MDKEKINIKMAVRIAILIIGIMIVVLVITVFTKSKVGVDSISRAIAYRNLGGSEQTSTFHFDDRKSNVFSVLGDGLLVASESGYDYYDKSGELFDSKSATLSNPAINSYGNYSAVFDIGGTELMVLNNTGMLYNITLDEGEIISAKVNKDGWTALCSTAPSAKGIVTVYNNEGVGVYEFDVRSGYPVTAAISPDSSGMHVLVLSEEGSNIFRYDFTSSDKKASYLGSDKLIFDIGYVSDSSLAAISQDEAVWINLNGETTGTYNFSDDHLESYSLDGGVLLCLADYKGASSGKLIKIGTDGKTTNECDITGTVRDMSVSEKYVAVLYNSSLTMFNSKLNEYSETDDIQGASEILVRQDGTILLISAFQATLYVP